MRVHAHLCGDGYCCKWKTKEKDRKYTAVVGYSNKNQELLRKFRLDFSKLFNVKMKKKKDEVSIRSIKIFSYLDNAFGSFKSREWRIPCEIKMADKHIKLEWLKAFFEGEAYHEERYNRLKIKSMNPRGLRDSMELLVSLNIKSTLTGPNCDESYYLTIPSFGQIKEFKDFKKIPIRQKRIIKTPLYK